MGRRVVVLISGSGSNLQALLDADDLGGDIVLVGSDRPGVLGLKRAEAAGVPTAVVPFADYEVRDDWDRALFDRVADAQPDLVVAAGFMRLLAPRWIQRWPVLNTHPALLPSFPGAHGVRDALAYGVKVTGATVMFIDDGVDTGPIVAQAAVPVLDGDDEITLHERIKTVEHRLLSDAVKLFCSDRLVVDGRHVRINP